MTLYETIGSDIKDAMKAKDTKTLETLRLVSSELTNYEKLEKGNVLNDATVLKILTKEFTKRIENVKFYNSKGIDTGAQKEQEEADIISKYLPKSASEDQVNAAVTAIFKDADKPFTVKDTGLIMNHLTAVFSVQNMMFDRKTAASIISNLLKTQSNG